MILNVSTSRDVRDVVSPATGRRRFLLAMAFALAVLAMSAAWLTHQIGGPAGTRTFADIVETLVALTAAFFCWRSSRAHSGRDRRGWLLLCASGISWGVGQAVWSYIELVLKIHPFPSPADIFFVASFPLSVAGLLTFRASPSGFAQRLRVVLDGLIVWSSVFFVGWAVLLGPVYHANPESFVSALISMAYPAADVVLVAVALTVAARARRPRPFAFISAGILCMAVADGFSAVSGLMHLPVGASLTDLGWIAGFLLVGLGAMWRLGDSEAHVGRTLRLRSLMPYAAWPPALAIVAVKTVQGHPLEPVLVWLAVALGALVLSRQMLWILDNHTLARGLEQKVVARTAELGRSEERFRSIVHNTSDVVFLLDADLRIGYTTESSERILGLTPAELTGIRFTTLLDPEERARIEALLDEARRRPGSSVKTEHRLRRSAGRWSQFETIVANLLESPGVGALVLTARDVTQRKGLEDQLRVLAFHDPLTGLPNRTLFRDRLVEALEHWRRSEDRCAVMLLDLDNFKTVNDSLGHAVGDELLKQVADRITGAVRLEDTVARAGGDEFTILLRGVGDGGAAVEVADRVLEALAQPFAFNGREVSAKASIGIAVAGPHGTSGDELLRNADVAMYTAKTRGRGRYELFAPALHAAAIQRLEREVELREAIARHQLVLHYQPIVDLAANQIIGVEALVRWDHPNFGLLFPGDFIPLAEETGLIVALGEWVLNEACRQVAIWQHDGTAPGLTVSVNLSSRQLHEADLPACVARALAASGIDPDTLVLEITESLLLDDGEETMQRLHALRALGVQLAMDDFGTGYSSLAYLSRLPIQILKIDRAFVSVLGRSVEDAAVVRAILSLARTFGMRVVAEGIERPEEVLQLRELGCGLGQGFYFSRPLDPEALVIRLSADPKMQPAAERMPASPVGPRLTLAKVGGQ
jgi:diguanylate cyclase (GGDEF)-like protein/PAS domain S-box-containing protein